MTGRAVKFPAHPKHPERICWGCDNFCPADDMACTKVRTMHPAETFSAPAAATDARAPRRRAGPDVEPSAGSGCARPGDVLNHEGQGRTPC